MLIQFGKRSVALLLALTMVFSMVPVQAFAMEDSHAEGETHEILTAISVTTLPGKTEYVQNQETLDVSGGVLTLTYQDGCTETVAMTADMVSGFDSARAGVQTLTVTYGGLTTAYSVTVSAPVAAASETEPEQTAPTETTPAETIPAETTPVETTPAESTPAETTPAESIPAETVPEETVTQEEPSALALDLAERINAMLAFYGVTAQMTDDEIGRAINAKSWSENKPNIARINAIEADAQKATEEEARYVVAHADVETFVRFQTVWKPMFAVMKAASGGYVPVDGVDVAVSGASSKSMSGGAVTVTAKGYGGFLLGIGAYASTATITIYNTTENKANISFSWTCTNVHSLTVDGTSKTGGSGSYTKTLEAGASLTIKLTTDKNNTENKIVLKDFSVVEVVEVDTQFLYDSSLGSITVGGQPVENEATLTVAAEGTDVAATPKSGSTFLGWIDQNNKVISRDAAFTLMPSADMTQVRAVFAATSPWFLVDSAYLYEGLTLALEKATALLVLMNNATLPAGNYTIPAGVTLLIPFDEGNTLYTTDPECINSFSNPTVYRTLTMASGANIVVNGVISLSARESAQKQRNGHPTGPVSRIVMADNSSITVNSGANLYAWGFISGSGKVTVNSGGTVYENFQLTNWRGGDATLSMIDNKQRVLPMSQYYVQNAEVTMYLMAGATEKCHMSIYIGGVGIQDTNVPFVGADGMFNILGGYVMKDYEEGTDRLRFDVYDGNVAMKPLSISMKLSFLGGTKTINSASYTMPINSNITVHIHSGNIVVEQDIGMLPGSRLIVDAGARCTVGKDKKIFAYDADQWGTYLCDVQKKIMPLDYSVPGRTCAARGEGSLVDAEVVINGTVEISLMLDDTVIGQKTMHIVLPNNLYFTKAKLDAVYGETVELPLKALYDGKPVTIKAEDVTLTMDNPAAGTFDGFAFTASSAGTVRTVNVTAALTNDASVKASVSLSLYNQGEASFAFEQAIGGDRQLAWDRRVSNSTTEDNVTYNVVTPGRDMVTSYTFAIDMTQIPVPERLEELTYMLPGADMEGASAWTFLLQLAQRVSVLSRSDR